MAWTSSKWGKFWLWSSIWPWRSRSIVPQNNRDLNQGLLHLWSKFGDPSWNGWWVITRTSSWLTHGRTHRQTDAGNDNTRRPKLASGNKRWYEPGYCTKRKWIVIITCFTKKVFLWQMVLSLACLWCDKIALRLWLSSSSYAPLAIWEINWRFDYDLCNQVAICLRYERIATDLCARESTNSDLGDHGDQLEANQRSISILEDLCDLHGALWRSHRSPPSEMGV